MTDVDVSSVIEHLEFEPEVLCSDPHATGEAADWYVTCKGCREVDAICEPHRVRMVRAAGGVHLILMACTGRLYRRLEDAFTFTPVKRGAR